MIEKIIRDLDYADYRLVDYGTETILVEYKEKAQWRVVKKEHCYVLVFIQLPPESQVRSYTQKGKGPLLNHIRYQALETSCRIWT